jgi:hypothetical protein
MQVIDAGDRLSLPITFRRSAPRQNVAATAGRSQEKNVSRLSANLPYQSST